MTGGAGRNDAAIAEGLTAMVQVLAHAQGHGHHDHGEVEE